MDYSLLALAVVMSSMTAKCDGEGKVYKKGGDLIIGGLLTIHDYDENTQTCGNVSSIGASARAEAIAYAVSKLNNDSTILDGFTLGYEIHDTCSLTKEAIASTLNFLPPHREEDDVIGIVGPRTSAEAIHVTDLLSLYNISMISHLATSDELSNSQRYPYFLRTVPPDKFQVSVIADILVNYDWKYVAFLYTDDSYGKNAEAEFSMQAQEKEICIGYTQGIPDSADDMFFKNTLNDLLTVKNDSLLSVVILFMLPKGIRLFFEQALAAGISGDFIWIGSDGWGAFGLDPVEGLEKSAVGALTIAPKAGHNPNFSSYFMRTIHSSRNPWVPEIVKVAETDSEQFPISESQSLESVIIDSVEVFARGLDAMRKDLCDISMNVSTCRKILFKNRRLLRDHLLQVTFTSTSNGLVAFTEDGDSQGRYDIKYLQQMEPGVYIFNYVGSWLNGNATNLQIGTFDWYLKRNIRNKGSTYTAKSVPKSVCRDPCGPLKIQINNMYDCCWKCETCKENEIIKNNECISCFFKENQTYLWPNKNLTHCMSLDNLKIRHEGEKIAILVIVSICIVAEVIVTYLYIKNRERRLIKASSRELGYIILVGVFLSYLSAILYSTPPSPTTCFLRRIIPNIGTAFIYISLATMTVRLHRIFRSGQRTAQRTRFISPKSQVLLTLILSLIPFAWGLFWIFVTWPKVTVIEPTKEQQMVRTSCVVSKPHGIGQLAWDVLVVLFCCYFAFKTKNLPANYNQTRFIAFCVFSTLVVFIAFAPAFFTSQDDMRQQNLYSAIGAIIQSTVVLLLIFVARLYALYFVNEENQQLVTRRPSTQSTLTPQAIPVNTISKHLINEGDVIRITVARTV